jgi:hypothetical protein
LSEDALDLAQDERAGRLGPKGAILVKLEILGSGSLFEIVAHGAIVRCTLTNRDDVDAEEGARCAAALSRILSDVLGPDSPYTGVVIDVRHGPPVFGPKTRASLERLFARGEQSRRRIAIRVGTAAIQKLQFSSLCRDQAPTQGRVFETDEDAGWAAGG